MASNSPDRSREVALTAAIIPAAGRGERLGALVAKALVLLGGEPLLVHAVRAMAASVEMVVVAAPADSVDEVAALLHAHGLDCAVVAGGASRQDSVRAALAVLPDSVEVVLVHDAARALAPATLAAAVVVAVRGGASAVVPGVAVADTVKVVDASQTVTATPDRAHLRAVQTPQGFARDVLVRAHALGVEATDDAGLVEALGLPVLVIPGSDEAFKITRPLDLVLAEAVLARRA